MRDVLTNQTQENLDALNCEAEMMTALSRLFGEAYMRGRAQGRNEAATNATSTPVKPGTHDEGLVERLVDRLHDIESEHKSTHDLVRAILSELASMPCELPTANAIAQAWNSNAPHAPKVSVLHMLRVRLVPILAAKDARIAALETENAQRMEDALNAGSDFARIRRTRDEQIAELKARIEEIITDRDNAKAFALATAKEGAATLGKALARIAELETSARLNAEQADLREKHVAELEKQLVEALEERDNARGELASRAFHQSEMETRLAEQASVDATGKTPGQVMTEKAHELFYAPDKPETPFAWDWLSKSEQRRADETALAVLRAFGNAPTIRDMSYDDMVRTFGQEGVGHIVELALDKTGRNETAEALQRVRERAQTIETHFRDGSGAKQPHTAKGAIKDFTTIIDVELAKLDQ